MIELAYGTCTMLGNQAVAVGDGLPLFTQLPLTLILGNSQGIGHKKRAGTFAPSPLFFYG